MERCSVQKSPLRLTTFASSPKGTPLRYAENFPATAKSRPLGEGGLPLRVKTEGVFPPSAALSQKAALQLPFFSTTPPLKMGFRNARRRF